MAKREPIVDMDLGENGGRLLIWTPDELRAFYDAELAFWSSISGGRLAEQMSVAMNLVQSVGKAIDRFDVDGNYDVAKAKIYEVFADPQRRIPLSYSAAGQSLSRIYDRLGRDAARGAVAMVLPVSVWSDGIHPASRPHWRGMIEQVVNEAGVTAPAVEAMRRTLGGLHGRFTQVMADIEIRANEQLAAQEIEFSKSYEAAETRIAKREAEHHTSHMTYTQGLADALDRFENTHNAYIEHMKLKAPVEYWREKASKHKKAAGHMRNWLAGFFFAMIAAYLLGFILWHQDIAAFLLQFQASTGALLVISAAFALLASLPLWIGRLLVKFYLSEHHLATDAREREVMTQTYLALTADGVVDDKDRTLILSALFRSTPDGVVKDNAAPDTSPAAMLSRLLDSR